MSELAAYDTALSKRPQVVILTKIEGLDKKQLDTQVKALKKVVPKSTQVMAISSLNREGVSQFLYQLNKMAAAARQKAEKESKKNLPVIGLKEEDSWRTQKNDDGFTVTGQKIERFARRTNFGDYYGEQRLYDILRKEGIVKELERQGVKPGQKIRIGQPVIGELEY
jgi:GTP-binding protein